MSPDTKTKSVRQDAYNPGNPASQVELCFILGILWRSGTNYLYRLLRTHPDCAGPGPIWEDWLTYNSHLLKSYTDKVFSYWKPESDAGNKIGTRETLLRYLGDGLSRFLKLQVDQALTETTPAAGQGSGRKNTPKILLTKTPNVNGLGNFFSLFPDARLILLIRDGRAAVESGVRAFGWKYEKKMREWAEAARIILEFKERNKDLSDRFLIVRYEDIHTNLKSELLRIFAFLGLNPGLYDFDAAQSYGVIGSSQFLKKPKDKLNWSPVKKDSGFNPLERFGSWDRGKLERFIWLAGSYMSEFGYDAGKPSSNKHLYIARNKLLDLMWRLRTAIQSGWNIIIKVKI